MKVILTLHTLMMNVKLMCIMSGLIQQHINQN